MLREVVASPSQGFSWTLLGVIPGNGRLNGCVLVRCVPPKIPQTELVPCDYWNPLAVVKSTNSAESNPSESSRPWSRTVANISIFLSVPVSISVEIPGEQTWVVNPVECYSCGWTNQFIISYLSICLRWFKFMSYWYIKLCDISPLCDVAQTSDCGTLVIYSWYKPFMWCRTDARLRHFISTPVLLIRVAYK